MQALRGSAGGRFSAADNARLKAVTGFAGFLTELSDEADKVHRIRAVMVSHPADAGPLIEDLRDDLRGWDRRRAGDQILRQTMLAAVVQRAIDRRPPASVEARRPALSSQYALAERHEASLARY